MSLSLVEFSWAPGFNPTHSCSGPYKHLSKPIDVRFLCVHLFVFQIKTNKMNIYIYVNMYIDIYIITQHLFLVLTRAFYLVGDRTPKGSGSQDLKHLGKEDKIRSSPLRE